jgi:hypothetical protein
MYELMQERRIRALSLRGLQALTSPTLIRWLLPLLINSPACKDPTLWCRDATMEEIIKPHSPQPQRWQHQPQL